MMPELQYKVVLDSEAPTELKESVGFGEFEAADELSVVYGVEDLIQFHKDLILGRPLPLTFVAKGIQNLGTFVALLLFLQRDLAIHPAVPGFVVAVSLYDSYGVSGLAHVDRDLSRLLKALRSILVVPPKGSDNQSTTLTNAVSLCRDYLLNGRLPNLKVEGDPPAVLERGTNGFVVARTTSDLLESWEELYRQGYLRGVVLRSSGADRWDVLAARKSLFVGFDLIKAASALNDAEVAMGEPVGWSTDGFWLSSPDGGTLLLPSMVLQILLVC